MKVLWLILLNSLILLADQQLTCEEVRTEKIKGLDREELMGNLQVCGVDSFDFPLIGAYLIEKIQKKEEFDTLTCGDVIDYIETLRGTLQYQELREQERK